MRTLSLRNADRRSNQSVAALGALVAHKRGCVGALPAALPLFAAGLGALGLLRLGRTVFLRCEAAATDGIPIVMYPPW